MTIGFLYSSDFILYAIVQLYKQRDKYQVKATILKKYLKHLEGLDKIH